MQASLPVPKNRYSAISSVLFRLDRFGLSGVFSTLAMYAMVAETTADHLLLTAGGDFVEAFRRAGQSASAHRLEANLQRGVGDMPAVTVTLIVDHEGSVSTCSQDTAYSGFISN